MAIEFDWYGDASVDTATLRAFIATATSGEQRPDGTIFLDGMYVMARASSDEDGVIVLFGSDQHFSATFRFSNVTDDAKRNHNTAVMVRVLIAFAQAYQSSGVLLFNGERNVLQYGADGIVFDAAWEDWTANRETDQLLHEFSSRRLPQPLL